MEVELTYHQYKDWHLSGNFPIELEDGTTMGDVNHPMNFGAFDTLNSSSCILNNTRYSYDQRPLQIIPMPPIPGCISYNAEKSITLQPGFKVEHGALFDARIKHVFWSDFDQGGGSSSCEGSENKSCISNNPKNNNNFVNGKSKDSALINNTVIVYPNPVKSSITIVFDDNPQQDVLIKIYRIGFGEQVYKGKMNAKSTTIDLSSLSSGLYSLTIQLNNDLISRKIIKDKKYLINILNIN